MSKTRATTIQQRFGFKDDDLKTATHDQLMMWLNENVEKVTNRVIANEWTEEDVGQATRYLTDPSLLKLTDLPERAPITITEKIWEYPIISGKYVIGFVDMLIRYKADSITVFNEKGYDRYNEWRVSRFVNEPLCLEVKSTIPSLGELIRQIRMYQQYLQGCYVVVSPDARFADAIRSQGIGFYHCVLDPLDVAMT